MKNNTQPLVTVLMPVYNADQHLGAAIESILLQTFTGFECIVINDGSTDNSAAIIKRFSDSRIVYLENERNLGLIASLNKGLQVAKGMYVARMDADDVALPQRLQKQVEFLNTHTEVVAVGSNYNVVLNGKVSNAEPVELSGHQLKTILLFATCYAHPTVMFRRMASGAFLPYAPDFKHAEDYRLWTELAVQGELGYISEPLLNYRHHPMQVSVLHKSTQLAISRNIRAWYLKQLGFSVSEAQLDVHCTIGNNTFITSKHRLREIEAWLLELNRQNELGRYIGGDGFGTTLQKFWTDSCGNSNLGLWAWQICLRSPLSRLSNFSAAAKIKLLVKCLLRAFKQAQ